jgi:hypothetical protein
LSNEAAWAIAAGQRDLDIFAAAAASFLELKNRSLADVGIRGLRRPQRGGRLGA